METAKIITLVAIQFLLTSIGALANDCASYEKMPNSTVARELIKKGFAPLVADSIASFRPDVLEMTLQGSAKFISLKLPFALGFEENFVQDYRPRIFHRGICIPKEKYDPRFSKFGRENTLPNMMYTSVDKNEAAFYGLLNCAPPNILILTFQVPAFLALKKNNTGVILREFVPDDRPFLCGVTLGSSELDTKTGKIKLSETFVPPDFFGAKYWNGIQIEAPLRYFNSSTSKN